MYMSDRPTDYGNTGAGYQGGGGYTMGNDGRWTGSTNGGGTGSANGNGGTAKKGSAGTATGGYDLASLLAAQLEARKAGAQKAYDALTGAARQNYDSAINQLNANYKANTGQVNADTDKSMQQAYINKMMSERNLGQQLAASGRSGGAAETTRLGLANNYGTTRGNLDTTRNEQLAQLALALQNSMSEQQQQLNSQLAQYEANLQNSLVGYGDDYYSSMMSNLGSLGGSTASSIAASNANTMSGVQSALQAASASNLANQLAKAKISNPTNAQTTSTPRYWNGQAYYTDEDYQNAVAASQAAAAARQSALQMNKANRM